jgi:hypothetical protein
MMGTGRNLLLQEKFAKNKKADKRCAKGKLNCLSHKGN